MTRRSAVLIVSAALTAACGGGPPPPPPVVPAPDVRVEVPALPVEAAAELPAPEIPEVVDEILRTPMNRDPEFRAEVDRWVEFWRTRASGWFPEYLERMAWFAPTVDSALSRKGLPPSLRYLPIIESGYSPRATSPVRAVGLWQFMAPTARGFGMGVSPLLDERRNPFKSTEAATTYLGELRDRFGSWFLALAAYNWGPTRLERLLDREAPLMPRSDRLYWDLRHRLPRETRDFVPKFYAAMEVASDPARHGYDLPAAASPFVFDEVVVPDATTLDVVARAAETDESEIVRLNPEVVRGITPPGQETLVRVPLGHGWRFRENYPRIPMDERVTIVEHRVQRGETLTHIARRYGVRVADIEAVNPELDPRRLQIGQRITVPIASSRRRTSG